MLVAWCTKNAGSAWVTNPTSAKQGECSLRTAAAYRARAKDENGIYCHWKKLSNVPQTLGLPTHCRVLGNCKVSLQKHLVTSQRPDAKILLKRKLKEEREGRKSICWASFSSCSVKVSSYLEEAWGDSFLGAWEKSEPQRFKITMLLACGRWTPHFIMIFLLKLL